MEIGSGGTAGGCGDGWGRRLGLNPIWAIPFNCRASDSILDAAVHAADAGADLDGETLALLLAGDVGHSDVPLRIAYHHHEQPRGHRRILRFPLR